MSRKRRDIEENGDGKKRKLKPASEFERGSFRSDESQVKPTPKQIEKPNYEEIFSAAFKEIQENKDLITIDLLSLGINFAGLDKDSVRFFYNKIIDKKFSVASKNLIFLDEVNENYFFDLIDEKEKATKDNPMPANSKMELDLLLPIYNKIFADNKARVIEIGENLKIIFRQYRGTGIEPEFEIDEMQLWVERVPAILYVLEEGIDDFRPSARVLAEFKNFAKSGLSQEELGRLQSEEKTEAEIIIVGIKNIIENRQRVPSPTASDVTASQASPKESQQATQDS